MVNIIMNMGTEKPAINKDSVPQPNRVLEQAENIVFQVSSALPLYTKITDEMIFAVIKNKFPTLLYPIDVALIKDIRRWHLQYQLEREPSITPEIKQMQKFIMDNGGKVSFADYMRESLYSKSGFYTERTNIRDDFTTYAMEPAFAELLLEHIKGSNINGTFVELAGGNGEFKSHFMSGDPKLQLDKYLSFDVSFNLARMQKSVTERRTGGASNLGSVVASAQKLPLKDNEIEGVIFSNELPDVFPCRVFQLKKDIHGVKVSRELFVTVEQDENAINASFMDVTNKEVENESGFIGSYETYLNNPEVSKKIQDGQIVSASFEQVRFLQEVIRVLKNGKIFIFDYGYNLLSNDRPGSSHFAYIPYNTDTKELVDPAYKQAPIASRGQFLSKKYINSKQGFQDGIELLIKTPYTHDITYEVDFGFMEWWLKTRHPELQIRCTSEKDFFRSTVDNLVVAYFDKKTQASVERLLDEKNSCLLLEITKN